MKTDSSGNPLPPDTNGNPQYALYTNSVMEYTARFGDIFDILQWGPYDKGALAWAYTNNAPQPVDPEAKAAKSITGQINATTPWNDPLGFDANGSEILFMSCHDNHLHYTPLCRQFDMGATPSEIIANQIETYDWQWNFNNFRVYHKFWDDSAYADKPANLMMDMRRFLLLWIYDWGSGEITDTLRRIGYPTPPNVPASTYYQQLENKFNLELSTANQLMATFHKAVIQQSTGQRPVATIYDQFYGDVTQQGHHPRQALRDGILRGALAELLALRSEPGGRVLHVVRHRGGPRFFVRDRRRGRGQLDGRRAVRRLPVLRAPRRLALRAGHAQLQLQRPDRGAQLDRRARLRWGGPGAGFPRLLPQHRGGKQLSGLSGVQQPHLHVRSPEHSGPDESQHLLRAGQQRMDMGLHPGPERVRGRAKGGEHRVVDHRLQLQ